MAAIEVSVDSEVSDGQGETLERSEGGLLLERDTISTGSAKKRLFGAMTVDMVFVGRGAGGSGINYGSECKAQKHEKRKSSCK